MYSPKVSILQLGNSTDNLPTAGAEVLVVPPVAVAHGVGDLALVTRPVHRAPRVRLHPGLGIVLAILVIATQAPGGWRRHPVRQLQKQRRQLCVNVGSEMFSR